MKMTFRLASSLVAIAFLALASASASAGVINFTFTNFGSVTGATSCGSNCLLVATSGVATETAGIAGANTWTFAGLMKFSATGLFSAEGNGTGGNLGWSFTDTSGNDNLWGSFSSDISTFFGLLGAGTVDYDITGGSGMFNGATGYGGSRMAFALGSFTEDGWMHVVTAANTSVPEPGMTTLLIAGIGIMGFMAYRRRRGAFHI
jgi:PEP-CTERM motif-containing protein